MTTTAPTVPAPSRLRADQVVFGHGDEVVLHGLSVELRPGRLTAVVGPNGCGKSTLLGALARLHRPRSGAVLLDGRRLDRLPAKEAARAVGLLPQSAQAPDGLTVGDLVRFGRTPHQGLLRQWSAADQVAVEDALAEADLAHLAERPVDTLSGGQRQRAWIAMAVAQDTPVLLLDEPTASLDLGHALEVFALLRRLADEGRTVVVVVHDLTSACRYADEIVALRDGRIIGQGAPRDLVTPELIAQLYDVEAVVVGDPVTGTPLVVPVRACPAVPVRPCPAEGEKRVDSVS
ncbi:MAG TPA: ABC transporter ATP-binding protein [Mycobacteriales bacterium]|jgi:iron complex transport system ATP-binding protein|nr:ABC transporter ATP-binding protein [Mycobacteriales bacterium]